MNACLEVSVLPIRLLTAELCSQWLGSSSGILRTLYVRSPQDVLSLLVTGHASGTDGAQLHELSQLLAH